MAFSFTAFCYILALVLTAFLIFFAVWQVGKYAIHIKKYINKTYLEFCYKIIVNGKVNNCNKIINVIKRC